MTIEKISVKKSANPLEEKAKVLPKKQTKKPRAKKPTKQVKAKSGKVEQIVNVNVGTGKGRGRRAAPKNVGFDPYPRFNQPTPSSAIAKKETLVDTPINNVVAPRVEVDPTNYLEGKNPRPKVPAAVKTKKGQNPYNVEVELQQGSFEVKPTAKGIGLAENVEQQTQVKIQVDKPKRRQTKIVIDKGDDFIQTLPGNTDKVISYDTQAEGTLEKNAEEGMTVLSKPRGRPKKYATEEERKEAKKASTTLSKKAKKEAEQTKDVERIKQLIKKTVDLPYYPKPVLTEAQKQMLSEYAFHTKQERDRRNIFLEGETYPTKKYIDKSLGKLYENQFNYDVNYNNLSNNNPVKQSLNETIDDTPAENEPELVVAGKDLQNYTIV